MRHRLPASQERLSLQATWIAAAFAAVLANEAVPSPAYGEAPISAHIEAEVRDGLLKVDARNAPLADVLRTIGEKAGFTVVIIGDLSSPGDWSLVDVSLEEGIERLVGKASTVMIYAPSDSAVSRLAKVIVYAKDDTLAAADAGESHPPDRAIKPPSVEESLLKDLAQPRFAARVQAFKKVARLESQAAMDILGRVVSEENDPAVRRQAAGTLGRIGGDQAAAVLETILADEDQSVRLRAVLALGQASGERATWALETILMSDLDPEMRRMAVRALGKRGGDLSRLLLESAVWDPDDTVRTAARQALAKWD